MGRRKISLLRPSLLRRLGQAHLSKTPLSCQTPPVLSDLSSGASPPKTSRLSPFPFPRQTSFPFPFSCRTLSSSSSPSNIVLLGSEEGLNTALNKVQDEKLHAIFYFTAVWCGPCKLMSPIIEEMSKKFPHVTTYKIDIDQEGLGSTLSKLKIYSVPTFHFYQKGTKATEVVGADVERLKDTMEKLYKED